MRIELRRSGGFAGHVRRPPLRVDTDALTPEQTRELEGLVDAVPALVPAPSPGADRMRFELEIARDEDHRTLVFGDAGGPPELRALTRRIRELAREA